MKRGVSNRYKCRLCGAVFAKYLFTDICDDCSTIINTGYLSDTKMSRLKNAVEMVEKSIFDNDSEDTKNEP